MEGDRGDPWYLARFVFLHSHASVWHPRDALKLASKSTHPDAMWFVSVLKEMSDPLDEFHTLYAATKDIRALYFDVCLDIAYGSGSYETQIEKLRIAARGGFPSAQAEEAMRLRVEGQYQEAKVFAKLAAEAGDAMGLFELSHHVEDKATKRDLLTRAMAMGHVGAAHRLRQQVSRWDPLRIVAEFRILELTPQVTTRCVFKSVALVAKKFLSEYRTNYGATLYECGRQLKHAGWNKKYGRLFGSMLMRNSLRERPCEAALDHYQVTNDNARMSVDAWSIIGKRIGVVKDIRLIIARMIWPAAVELYASKLDKSSEKEAETDRSKRLKRRNQK